MVASGIDEASVKPALLAGGLSPREVADALAELKASKLSGARPGLVIGADQTLDLDGKLVDKADDLKVLRETLRQMRGRTHELHSALVISEKGQPVWRVLKTARLTVRPFSDDWLDDYIASCGETVLCAVGGYHLEGLGVQLFSAIDGDYFTILGLPLVELLDYLRIRGAVAS